MVATKKQNEHKKRGQVIANAIVKALTKIKNDYIKSGEYKEFKSIKDKKANKPK